MTVLEVSGSSALLSDKVHQGNAVEENISHETKSRRVSNRVGRWDI